MNFGTGEATVSRPGKRKMLQGKSPRQPATLRLVLHLTFLVLPCLLAASPPAEPVLERQVFSEPHMGTLMQITLFAEDEETGAAAARAAFDRIDELNSILSDYDPESELMRLTKNPAGIALTVSDDLFEVLACAEEVSKQTAGSFDITVGPLSQLWREARRTKTLPEKTALEETRERIGYQKLQLDPVEQTVTLAVSGMQLDLGGIAKGYAADEALKVLRAHGVFHALVAAAGDLAFSDPPPGKSGWRIGIASTDIDRVEITKQITLKNHAVSTSGDTEQYVEIEGVRYSHIVDPATGLGLTERIGVTVLAPDATTADSLSTALSVMEPQRGLALVESLPGVEATLVVKSASGTRTLQSSGFPQP